MMADLRINRRESLQFWAIMLAVLISGCGPSPKSPAETPPSLTPMSIPSDEVGLLRLEVNKLRAEIAEQNQKRDDAEKRAQALSTQIDAMNQKRDDAEKRVQSLSAEVDVMKLKRDTAERRVQAISLIVRLLVYALVVTAIFFGLSHHERMLALKKHLETKRWGKWVLVGGFVVYLVYDIVSNASLITEWLLSRV